MSEKLAWFTKTHDNHGIQALSSVELVQSRFNVNSAKAIEYFQVVEAFTIAQCTRGKKFSA